MNIYKVAKAVKAYTVVGGILIAGLSVMAHQPQEVTSHNFVKPAPAPDPEVMIYAADGRSCSPKATLTDTIVVMDKMGKTLIMTFDETYRAAQEGKIKVITYCV